MKKVIVRGLRCFDVGLKWISVDLRQTIKSIARLPIFWSERQVFKKGLKNDAWPLKYLPCLHDHNQGAASLGEYFWQDLFVAKQIIADNPSRHIDVGSRIDGFVGHLACVRPVEVFDIRPLNHAIDNVSFVQWDITQPNAEYEGIADCVTCLHTLEHVGLGRYGDDIDADGWKTALQSLSRLLKPKGGRLWLSVPTGRQRVEFNAHRVFAPQTIVRAASECGLSLKELFYLSNDGIEQSADIEGDMGRMASRHYGLGIYLLENNA